jgi:hypothetical protein
MLPVCRWSNAWRLRTIAASPEKPIMPPTGKLQCSAHAGEACKDRAENRQNPGNQRHRDAVGARRALSTRTKANRVPAIPGDVQHITDGINRKPPRQASPHHITMHAAPNCIERMVPDARFGRQPFLNHRRRSRPLWTSVAQDVRRQMAAISCSGKASIYYTRVGIINRTALSLSPEI